MVSRRANKRTGIAALALAALSAVALAACSQGSTQQPSGLASAQAGATLSRIYRLGIGDKLKVTVFGEPELSGQFEVGALGQVSMPLIGDIKAKGLPIGELKEQIARRLTDGYLREPKVSVEVLNYRPFYVHGEVRSGGEFQFKNGVTMRDAVAMAGGYTYRANHNYVLLVREEEDKESRIDLPSAVTVLPGDNIRVPERFF